MEDRKRELRKQVRSVTAELDKEYISFSNRGIFENVVSDRAFAEAKTVFVYYSVGREPDTRRIIEYALKMGKTVALPRIVGGGEMTAAVLESTEQLVPGPYGIPGCPENAPELPTEAVELVIVPGLTFDEEGYRLGQGGGYYDRYLKKCGAYSIGLCRRKLLSSDLPRETHDMRVDKVITE